MVNIRLGLQRQRGLSLIELMVAITIGLLLMAGLLRMVDGTNRSYDEMSKFSRQLENGRYALDIIGENLQHAGFFGTHGDFNLPWTAALPDPCPSALSATNLVQWMNLPVQAYDSPASAGALNCLSDADHLDGTDILVIRRTSTTPATLGALTPGRFYLQSTGATVSPITQENSVSTDDATTFGLTWRNGPGTTTPVPVFAYEVHIYFISPCSRPTGTSCGSDEDDGGNPIPTLKRLVLSANPGTGTATFVMEPLVEGIQDMQLDFGVDTDDDGAPNGAYVTDPGTLAGGVQNWSDVVTVKVNLLARNVELTAGHNDEKTYSLGGTDVGPFNDNFKRHAYSGVIRVMNPSSRRE